jgi:signal transduction histidine kinase/DNA-binding response OmpR family regulator
MGLGKYILRLSFLVSPFLLYGQSHLDTFAIHEGNKGEYSVIPQYGQVLIDSSSEFSLDQVMQPSFDRRFQPLPIERYKYKTGCNGIFNNGCYTFWVKLAVKSEALYPIDFMYANNYSNADLQQIYFIRPDDSTQVIEVGYYNPRRNETIDQQLSPYFIKRFKGFAPITIYPQEELVIFSKIVQFSTPSYWIVPQIAFEESVKMDSERLGVVYARQFDFFFQGALWILFLFFWVLALLNRKPEFLFFALYNLCLAFIFLYILELDPWVFPNHRLLPPLFMFLSLAGITGVYAAFLFFFLDIPQNLPRLIPLYKFAVGSSSLLFLFVLIYFPLSRNYEFIDTIITYYNYLSIVLLVPFFIFSIRNRKREFNYFIIASLFLFIGSIGFFLIHNYHPFEGYLNNAIYNPHSLFFMTFILAELLTFAAGLGAKMLSSEREKVMLKTISEVKSNIYTNITHEFRTPLTIIMGMSENIKGHHQERKLIERNSHNLLRLVNKMMDVNKLESGKLELDLVNGNIIFYLRYLTESFQSMAEEKGLMLSFESTHEKVEMAFDEVKIQHIIYNLLSNAIKFTEPGGEVALTVSKVTINDIDHLELKIKDTGIGIPIDQIEKIFDRYYQARQELATKAIGSGIGLAFTKELTTFMGGALSVESEEGVGSTFSLIFPIKSDANARASSLKAVSESQPAGSSSSFQKEGSADDLPRLLIIEDNKDVAYYIQQLLHDKYQLSHAVDGEAGIQMAIETIPDIIISDVMMPKKDGFELCATLKSDERTSHIPIILLTAKATQADKIDGLTYGADAYLMKPFDRKELFVRLAKLIEVRKKLQDFYSNQVHYQDPPTVPEHPGIEERFLQKVRDALEEQIDNADFSVGELAKSLLLSNMQLYRKLKSLTGQNPTLFIRTYRLQKSKHLLVSTDLTVSEIAYDVGFTDPAYFSRAFKEEFGFPPSKARE